MKRIFDIVFSLFFITLLGVPIIVIFIALKLTNKGTPIYWSKRVGINGQIFLMPKFRTMKPETPQLATHLLTNPDAYLTTIGRILRKTSLDEVPQLYSILKGDMSFVGPRPALFNQDDLMNLRIQVGVHVLRPGLTGHAQINGRDSISIPDKVALDKFYLDNYSFLLDMKIIMLTVVRVVVGKDIGH
ncbi:MAG: hypothetical protein A2X86_18460 [Bdellovibrionales bacterium GWA2_49_15]|nr:MAG: hypothetical protein A2X86_18460 [Bdellovibrionales bacterium GWA2_49_15]HAZ11708.1 lipid carrier--UDP-N-acetylgalactosaminyltransferase [Bdellovibrionales bacterium]